MPKNTKTETILQGREPRAEEVSTILSMNISWNDIISLRTSLIEHLPEDRFLNELLNGVMRVAKDKQNPIRGNLVASGLREAIGHVLCRLAPDKEVRSCVWFEQAPDTRTVTRRQRANYIVQAGLPDAFVKETLKLDVRQFVQPLLESIEELHKATHIRAETIVHKGWEVREMIYRVFSDLLDLLDAAAESRGQMHHAIENVIHHAIFDRIIWETIQELDDLSTHTVVDGHHIDAVKIRKMDATLINYTITGQVDVELQYGSNSDVRNDIGFRQDDSFPYCATVSSNAANPMNIHSGDVDIKVDTSSFYE